MRKSRQRALKAAFAYRFGRGPSKTVLAEKPLIMPAGIKAEDFDAWYDKNQPYHPSEWRRLKKFHYEVKSHGRV